MSQDIFPAIVVVAPADHPTAPEDLRTAPATPDTYQIVNCRVVVSADRIIIAQDGNTGPKIVFSEAIASENFYKSDNPRAKHSYVTTESGKKIAFKRDSACACGSRLRSWNPYRNAHSVKDPSS
jgi:hypothetical protein